MKMNVGRVDRILRIALGTILLILAFTGTIGAWGYLGILLILTGVFRFCPAYLPFGFSSCKRD